MSTFDLNILPIHRINGQVSAKLPGLLAVTPPRRTARGREKDNLILYLVLSGNAAFTARELEQLNESAVDVFYRSAGSLTSAMRKSAESINMELHRRNLSTTGRGQYALGLLVVAVIREAQCTVLISGPGHAVWVSEGQSRHIYDQALSGKGLGSGQNVQSYLSQVNLHHHDLLVLCARFPRDWEADLLSERPPVSLEASYRKLTLTKGDLNAALIQPQTGPGIITVLRAEISTPRQAQPEPVSAPQTVIQPDAFPLQDEPLPQTTGVESGNDLIASPVGDHSEQGRSVTTDGSPLAALPHVYVDEEHADANPPSITEQELDELADFGAHMLQPSAYAIPPQFDEATPLPVQEETPTTSETPSTPRNFPPSIPRAAMTQPQSKPVPEPDIEMEPEVDEDEIPDDEKEDINTEVVSTRRWWQRKESTPGAHAEATRQMAKVMVGGIQSGRRLNERFRTFLQGFIPRLLPGGEAEPQQQQQMFFLPTYMLVFIAIIIPILVVTIASVVYLRYGQSEQYDKLYRQAQTQATQAMGEADPATQRDEWKQVLTYLDQADHYRQTDQSKSLRTQAQASYDNLMGIVRLEFIPAFTNGLSSSIQISRMAASESDLYMLDADHGNVLHAAFTGRSLQLDTSFDCQPGTYAGYQVGTLVDLIALPKINALGATVLGIDATGNLLYCAPGQVPQAIPLPALPNTNWGRITAVALDSGNLYVLDATSRAVWVFVGKDSTFVDTPYFYFSNQIPDSIDTAIDLAVSGDDLYMLHADSHVSTCTFSRIAETPTRCIDPVIYQDSLPAHQDINVFAAAHFTQMTLTNQPNSVLLLLDADSQKVFRFTPRSLELQNEVTSFSGNANPFQVGPVSAMTVSPNYVLYLSIGNQVYFTTTLP